MELPSAQKIEFSKHLTELYSILRQSVLLILITSILWGYASDSLMASWLDSLPLGSSSMDLSIYSPFDWIEMSWAISILLSIFTVMPLLSIRLQRFASPGLLPSERTWFSAVLAFCTFVLPLATILLWWLAFPVLFEAVLAADTLDGVGSRYDAASIFGLAIGVSWIIVCIILATVTLSLARLLGMVEEGHTRLRNRVLAILGGTLILSLPSEFEGLKILLALAAMSFAETISSSLPTATLGRRRFDVWNFQSGPNIIRLAILDCSCEGACPRIPVLSVPEGVASPTCAALCLNSNEQDALADLVSQHSITDLIVTGCDAEPIPLNLKRALSSSGCSIAGLGWLDEPKANSRDWRSSSIAHSTLTSTETALD